MSNVGAIGQISRSVSDVERSEEWFRSVLGLRHLYTFGPLAFFDDPDGRPLAIMAQVPG
ncbi:MAG TPA: VOC family protein [Trueperaceae bacterium]|nr:VOC family protein [Trueperaceae bacterium]